MQGHKWELEDHISCMCNRATWGGGGPVSRISLKPFFVHYDDGQADWQKKLDWNLPLIWLQKTLQSVVRACTKQAEERSRRAEWKMTVNSCKTAYVRMSKESPKWDWVMFKVVKGERVEENTQKTVVRRVNVIRESNTEEKTEEPKTEVKVA